MPLKFVSTIAVVAIMMLSCSSSANRTVPASSSNTDTTYTPVETQKPNTDYKPAFVGQTRIAGVKTTSAYQIKILSDRLHRPWGITSLPDGRFLITEKDGDMRIASQDGTLSEAITGIPKVNSSGQGGLLGLTLDPDFARNRMVYWVFSEKESDGNLTAVAKGKLSADEKTIGNAQVIYRATPAHNSTLHYGGRILFDTTGNLIFSTGERSDIETRPQAQYLNSSLGKIIRIITDGKAAPGNPFMNHAGARPELYSYGHRNVQGLAFNPVTGDLWESEFGPRGGDEINLIRPGKNYGWPIITYSIEYNGKKIGEGIQQKEGMEQPIYYWDPVISPSGMTFCSSDSIPEWKDNLFVCSLSAQHIDRLVIKDNKVVGEERLLADESQRFRDITQGKDGALYAITDQGRLYRIGK
ncbi:MAG: PQQ-dependent sugar dehydrogenase [Ginsengibacter sp.]